MTHVAGTAPVEPSVRRVWRELGSSPRPGPHAARRGWGVLQVVTVDVRNKKVVFKDGFKLEYSKLLLAPGSRWDGGSPCPLLDTRQGTSQGWEGSGCREPPTDAGRVSAPRR